MSLLGWAGLSQVPYATVEGVSLRFGRNYKDTRVQINTLMDIDIVKKVLFYVGKKVHI